MDSPKFFMDSIDAIISYFDTIDNTKIEFYEYSNVIYKSAHT